MTRDRCTLEFVRTAMSTTVSLQIVTSAPAADMPPVANAAFDWFEAVEAACSRFDDTSEVMALCRAASRPVPVSPLLFEVLRLALAVAEASDGAFDPTLGAALHALGFDRPWRSPHTTATLPDAMSAAPRASDTCWRHVELDEAHRTVTLRAPLLLDLGGIAKGFALDLAARALTGVPDCCLVVGGDLVCRGRNARGEPWRTAIVHPRAPHRRACLVHADAGEYALCTSGDYRRHTAAGHHLLDARHAPPSSARTVQSVTVVAAQAAIADALATAAFVLGVRAGRALLEAQQADGYFIDADGAHHQVQGWGRSHFTRVSD